MYIYSNNVHKCYKTPLGKAHRPIKALDPSKSHHFETEMCGPSCFFSIWIDIFCCAVHNLSIHILRTVRGHTIWPQKCYCDKLDFAGI